MPREKETFEGDVRPGDVITVGVIERILAKSMVREALEANPPKTKTRNRLLPRYFVVYLVIAAYLFMGKAQRAVMSLLNDYLCIRDFELPPGADKSAIFKARLRVGAAPLEKLYRNEVRPLAAPETKGAWWRGLRIITMDGSTLDLMDTPENRKHFGGPESYNGPTGYPQLRFTALCEAGTRTIFEARFGGYAVSEEVLGRECMDRLDEAMVLLVDRGLYSFEFCGEVMRRKAHFAARVQSNIGLRVHRVLPDGSYLTRVKPCPDVRRKLNLTSKDYLELRVVVYELTHEDGSVEKVRLTTDLLDWEAYPAREIMELYERRWEAETAFDELKTQLKGSRHLLRSKSPELVKQDFYGLLLAHYIVRSVMYEAAMSQGVAPNIISFAHAHDVIQRRLITMAAFPP